jgi:hypothetical protein
MSRCPRGRRTSARRRARPMAHGRGRSLGGRTPGGAPPAPPARRSRGRTSARPSRRPHRNPGSRSRCAEPCPPVGNHLRSTSFPRRRGRRLEPTACGSGRTAPAMHRRPARRRSAQTRVGSGTCSRIAIGAGEGPISSPRRRGGTRTRADGLGGSGARPPVLGRPRHGSRDASAAVVSVPAVAADAVTRSGARPSSPTRDPRRPPRSPRCGRGSAPPGSRG